MGPSFDGPFLCLYCSSQSGAATSSHRHLIALDASFSPRASWPNSLHGSAITLLENFESRHAPRPHPAEVALLHVAAVPRRVPAAWSCSRRFGGHVLEALSYADDDYRRSSFTHPKATFVRRGSRHFNSAMIASRGYGAANIDPSLISTFSTRSEDSQTQTSKGFLREREARN